MVDSQLAATSLSSAADLRATLQKKPRSGESPPGPISSIDRLGRRCILELKEARGEPIAVRPWEVPTVQATPLVGVTDHALLANLESAILADLTFVAIRAWPPGRSDAVLVAGSFERKVAERWYRVPGFASPA